MDKKFKYTGETRDYGGTDAYHYEGEQWIIAVWVSFPKNQVLLQGSLENMQGSIFEFTLGHGDYLTYSRVLQSNYDGLGIKYDENDKLVPKYVIKKIKEVAYQMLNGNADWQQNIT